MIPCVYSKQKKKKLKTWFDGFVALKNNKMMLYDEDKKMIDSKTISKLSNEMETMRHVIYVETECDFESEEVIKYENKMKFEPKVKPDKKNEDAIYEINDDDINQQDEVQVCRSNEDILNLFMAPK